MDHPLTSSHKPHRQRRLYQALFSLSPEKVARLLKLFRRVQAFLLRARRGRATLRSSILKMMKALLRMRYPQAQVNQILQRTSRRLAFLPSRRLRSVARTLITSLREHANSVAPHELSE